MEIFFGLIIVFFIWLIIKTKSQNYYASEARTERDMNSGGEAPYPSWSTNKNKMEEFAAMLNSLANRRSIPKRFVSGLMTTDYSQKKLFFTAGLMERQGASFEEQTMAVMKQIDKYWENMDSNEKKMLQDQEAMSNDKHTFSGSGVSDEDIKKLIIQAAKNKKSGLKCPNLEYLRINEFVDNNNLGGEWFPDYHGLRTSIDIDGKNYFFFVETIKPDSKDKSGVKIFADVIKSKP